MSDRYKLDDDGTAVACENLLEWALWFESADRTVVKTEVGDKRVSTVFLGLDHNYSGDGPPVLWETMVFGPDGAGDEQERYTSVEAARKGHQRFVDGLTKGIN